MPPRIAALAVIAALGGPAAAPAQPAVFPDSTWATATPAEVGLDVAKLDELAQTVGGAGFIVRYGYHVYAWGDTTHRWDWGSASKPVISTLLFFADQEGLCTIQSAVGDFMPGGSPKDSSITFFHLANMTSGYSRGEWPGQAWAYNDFAINLYGYVLCYQVFGMTPQAVFDGHFGFLQMEDAPVLDGASQYARIKHMSVRDYARLGLFWLHRGNWDGVQILPPSYFDTYVTNQVPSQLPRTTQNGPESWNLGSNGGGDNQTRNLQGHYGMNFWVNTNGLWAGLPANVYQANGHDGGEVCTILPDLELVAASAGASWGHPSTATIQLLYDAAGAPTSAGRGTKSSSWGGVKVGYRR
jgi:CubicO group peptidase (beta-lactamase class C family)